MLDPCFLDHIYDSLLIYFLFLVEHNFIVIFPAEEVNSFFSRSDYVWWIFLLLSYAIDSLAVHRLVGWEWFLYRILKALLYCLLVFHCCFWGVRCRSSCMLYIGMSSVSFFMNLFFFYLRAFRSFSFRWWASQGMLFHLLWWIYGTSF